MASTVVLPKAKDSFVYEDLVSRVQIIQNQILQINKVLDDRWKNQMKTRQELKSRSLTFVDPYGNRATNQYMDHEVIATVFEKYKKSYIPKCLNKWIKIGKLHDNQIVSLNNLDLTKTVSEYEDGLVFQTYGEIVVWIQYCEFLPSEKYQLIVQVTDNMENIKDQLRKRRTLSDFELRSVILENNSEVPKSIGNDSVLLKSEDTVLSAQLYQDSCMIVVKIIQKTVDRLF